VNPEAGAVGGDPPGLRLAELRAWLARRRPDVDRSLPLRARLMPAGRSNVTYLLSQQERRWVLRRPPLGHVMQSAHDMEREFRLLSGLTRVGFPVPRPYALCQDPTVIGAPFVLMEHVEGRVISDAADAGRLDEAEASQICAAAVAHLAQLHDVDVDAAGLSDLGRPLGYLARQVRRWSQQWESTRTRDLPEIVDLVDWLAERVGRLPEGLPQALVHGDYRIDNLILAPSGPEVRAVLDWEMSTRGDPVADLAVMLVYWSRPGDTLRHRVPVAEGVTDGPGFWDRRRLADAYADATGHDLSHLDVCLALACLKLAVIMESIHFRNLAGHQLGTAARHDATAMGRAAEALVALGLEVAQGGGLDALSR
jgi:aminoglycoside phosphotransferase (APT) family kinase protein